MLFLTVGIKNCIFLLLRFKYQNIEPQYMYINFTVTYLNNKNNSILKKTRSRCRKIQIKTLFFNIYYEIS